jgi:hypothetical protein
MGAPRERPAKAEFDRKELMTKFGAPRRALPRRPGANSPRFIDRQTALPNRVAIMNEVEFALTQQPFWVAVALVHAEVVELTIPSDKTPAVATVAALAQRLRETLRPSDLIGRLGELEVGAALWGLDNPEPAQVVEQRIRRAFGRPVDVPGGRHPLLVSIGIGLARPGDTPSTALASAWAAMQNSAPLRPRREAS